MSHFFPKNFKKHKTPKKCSKNPKPAFGGRTVEGQDRGWSSSSEATGQALAELVAKGAMPGLVLHVDDCRAEYDRMLAAGVEFTQEPVERFGNIDAGFRDPAGNGWKMIQRGGRTR